MSSALHKKSIIKKTLQVGGSTLLSRFFGILRELLMVRFLGVGIISDAFVTAYKIPNSLRKIFAEGALSAAFIPTLVKTSKEHGKKTVNSLMSLAFLVFEGLVLFLCSWVILHAEKVVSLIAPGFSAEQAAYAVPFLRILMPFLFFISSSALLAGALQSVSHFFVPAFAPVLLNIVFVSALALCLTFGWPVQYLCYFILFGGLLQFLLHLWMYFRLGFTFAKIDKQAWQRFRPVFAKFLLCLVSMSVMEVSLFIDTSFASLLSKGSISLIYYANRFMGIPLGVFAVAFSTILLPHFSRVATYAPKRLSFYLLEAAKFVCFVTLPVAMLMAFFSEKVFSTVFLSEKFTMAHVMQAKSILVAFVCGLFFFALNKILLNIYYALHVTWLPAIISALATLGNVGLNFLLMQKYQATGLAFATTLSGALQTLLFLLFLSHKFDLKVYWVPFMQFFVRYAVQLVAVGTIFFGTYNVCSSAIALLPTTIANFLLINIGFWLWVGPLCGLLFLVIFTTRKQCGLKLHFID